MRIYRIWLDRFEIVSKYGMKLLSHSPQMQENSFMKQRYKMCECLKFNVGGVLEEVFSIYEIDSLFAGYNSEKEFLQKLEKFPNEKYQRKKGNNLLVTYTYKEELKQLDLVFNSPLLKLSALLARREQNAKKGVQSDKKILQQQYEEEFQKLLNRLLNITENEETREYLFSPLNVESSAPTEQLKKLSKYLPPFQVLNTINTTTYRKICQNNLYQNLFLYAQAFDAKKGKERLYLSTTEEDKNLLIYKENISRLLRRNYQMLRNSILFVKTFEEIKKCEKEKLIAQEDEDNKQLQLYINPTTNRVHALDPYTQKVCDETAQIEEENQDLLRKYAYEAVEKWQDKYNKEPLDEDDGYSFEELDMEELDMLDEKAPKISFIKEKKPWNN